MYWGSCVCYCDLYIKSREAYSKRLSDLQGLRWMVADMKVRLDAARLLIHRAAASAATGFPSESQAAIAKTFANEAALQVISDAMQRSEEHTSELQSLMRNTYAVLCLKENHILQQTNNT